MSFDLPGHELAGNAPSVARSLPHPDRQLPIGSPPVELVRGFESPYGDRLSPIGQLEQSLGRRHPLAKDTLVFKSPDGLNQDVVIHCPITGVTMTETMARAVDLNRSDLQAMVNRDTPLGLTHDRWERARSMLFHALSEEGLYDSELIVKAGGSSVSGFSSRATALNKKSFPATLDELRDKVIARGQQHGHIRERIETHVVAATEIWREMAPERKPRAPWWGAMHALGLEHAPDVDVQIWSPKIDAALRDHSELSAFMPNNNAKDRLGRWFPAGVFHQFKGLGKLQLVFQREGIHLDLEFHAGADARERMNVRTDWWDVRPPQYSLSPMRR